MICIHVHVHIYIYICIYEPTPIQSKNCLPSKYHRISLYHLLQKRPICFICLEFFYKQNLHIWYPTFYKHSTVPAPSPALFNTEAMYMYIYIPKPHDAFICAMTQHVNNLCSQPLHDTLHHTAPHCTTLHHTAQRCNTQCNTLQYCVPSRCTWVLGPEPYCTTLHRTAPRCNS